jgi:cellulose synthase (UDP-forming)
MTDFGPPLLLLGMFLVFGPWLPTKKTWARSLLVALVLFLSFRYLKWRLDNTLPGGIYSLEHVWMYAVYAVEIVGTLSLGVMLLVMTRTSNRSQEADAHEARLRSMDPNQLPRVDILIPTYNEELEVLERTILGAIDVDYPHFDVYVLDDGKRDWLKAYCEEKGVNYIRRATNEHAKAGNLNNALKHCGGEFVAILDADFVPQRNLLFRTVGFFEDPKIGILQTPQYFFNPDPIQHNLKISDVWVDEQRLTFEDMQSSRDAWNCAYCCGSCSVLRRKAIDEVGGIPTKSVTEDVLSTLVMIRAGYITRYLNEKLTQGLAPESLEAFFVQRQRWCRGGVQIMFSAEGPFGPGLTFLQRLMFSTIGFDWIIQCIIRLTVLLVPLSVLLLGMRPYQNISTGAFFCYQFTVWLALKYTLWKLAPRRHMPLITTATWLLITFRIWPTVISTLIRPFGAPFRVTPKGSANRHKQDRFVVNSAIFLIALNVFALLINQSPTAQIVSSDLYGIAGLFCFYNIVLLVLALLMSWELPRGEQTHVFPANEPCRIESGETVVSGRCRRISVSGARVTLDSPLRHAGRELAINLGPGRVSAELVRRRGKTIDIRFREMSSDVRDRMISWIYGGGFDNVVRQGKVSRIAFRLLKRAFLWC